MILFKKPITQEDILKYLCKKWELGCSDGRWWFQKKLCCGGDSIDVHASSAWALFRKGKIKQLPSKKTDKFWLNRYGLVT